MSCWYCSSEREENGSVVASWIDDFGSSFFDLVNLKSDGKPFRR